MGRLFQVANEELTRPAAVHARREEIQIVDVREAYEWEAGRIEEAVHAPLNQLMAATPSDLDPARPVVCVCRSGNRSELAAVMLRARLRAAAPADAAPELRAPGAPQAVVRPGSRRPPVHQPARSSGRRTR